MPRDPKRINIVLKHIRKYWKKHTDERFFQMLWSIGFIDNHDDPYYKEDDALIRQIETSKQG